jgi:hypothetical protein
MNTHSASTFKTLTLLCTISLSSLSFAAAPAPQARPSLEDQLAILEAMEDTEIVCKVLPQSQDDAEQSLADVKRIFQDQNSACVKDLRKHQAQYIRLTHQWWAINKEIEGCGDHARRNRLQAQQRELEAKYVVSSAESQKYADSLIWGNMVPLDAYNYKARQSNVFRRHASFLLAQKEKAEKEKIQLQQRDIQWLQKEAQSQIREQALLAQLKGYQRLEDGPQIEGVPNVPGGPKQVIKRRGSF